ncbi:MAG TPA: SIR2 family protein [Pyrinomonadaceae bacterium]|nr:SIR2 family protein [Pyrinomonadaceae bacterium]
MPPPPYLEIADLLRDGKVIPFLGAGVNFGTRQPPDALWDERSSHFLPSGPELSRYLARRISFPSDQPHDLDDLAKVAAYFVETSARVRLRERLQDIFVREYTPSSVHLHLADIARKSEAEIAEQPEGRKEPGTPLLVVTTNYDDLLEQAFNALGRPYDLVIYPTDRKDIAASVLWWPHGAGEPEAVAPNQLCIDLKNTNVIYKMHGSVDRGRRNLDSFVITEDDYIDFLSRMTTQGGAVPAQFMRYFRARHFLFLGYGLGDWNLRVVLRNLRNILPPEDAGAGGETAAAPRPLSPADDQELTSWAIQFRPTDLEKELWRARKVKIYDQDINAFVRGLREEVQ